MNFDELDRMGAEPERNAPPEAERVRAAKINEATEKAAHWLALGNAASERGEDEKAERHYDRAQKWQDKMNEMLRDRWPTY